MATLYQLINTERATDRANRRRVWVRTGEHVGIGKALLTAVAQREIDGDYTPVIELRSSTEKRSFNTDWDQIISLRPWARMRVIPRSVRLGPGGRPECFLLEFVRLSESVQWAV